MGLSSRAVGAAAKREIQQDVCPALPFGLRIADGLLTGPRPAAFLDRPTISGVTIEHPRRMADLHDLRLRLLVQLESERIA